MKINNRPKAALPRSFFLPYPELIEPRPHEGPWTVADSNDQDWLPTNGATDIQGKRVFVPLEPGGEGVTLHESAHIRWSPEKFPRVRFPLVCLQAIEDARINLGLREVGLPFTLDRESRAKVAHLAATDGKQGQYAATILRAIASLGTDAAELMRDEVEALPEAAAELGRGWLAEVEGRLTSSAKRSGNPVASFWVARFLAKRLANDLQKNGLMGRDNADMNIGCCHVVGPGDGDDDTTLGKARRLSAYERMMRRKAARRGYVPIAVGRMRIARPPLTLRQPSVLRGGISRSQCRTEGTEIVRPDRLVLDGAIFGRAAQGGGTVLLDASGSMAITPEEVEAIVRAAGGAATVAMYSGKGDVGELRIIARADRRVTNDHLEPFGSGNIVDLPALEWLARQPSPRLWVSDGGVTGVGDEGCGELRERCQQVVARSRIERLDTAEEALERLA